MPPSQSQLGVPIGYRVTAPSVRACRDWVAACPAADASALGYGHAGTLRLGNATMPPSRRAWLGGSGLVRRLPLGCSYVSHGRHRPSRPRQRSPLITSGTAASSCARVGGRGPSCRKCRRAINSAGLGRIRMMLSHAGRSSSDTLSFACAGIAPSSIVIVLFRPIRALFSFFRRWVSRLPRMDSPPTLASPQPAATTQAPDLTPHAAWPRDAWPPNASRSPGVVAQ